MAFINKDIFILDFSEMADGYYKLTYSVHARTTEFKCEYKSTWVSVDTKTRVFNTKSEYYDWLDKCKDRGYSISHAEEKKWNFKRMTN